MISKRMLGAVGLFALVVASLLAADGQTTFVEFLNQEYRKHTGFSASLDALHQIDQESLSPSDQLSYNLFEWYLEDQIFFMPIALGEISAGDVLYQRLLQHYTTTDWSAAEWFERLSNDVSKYWAEAQDIYTQLGIEDGSPEERRAEADRLSDHRANENTQAVTSEMQAFVDAAQATFAPLFSIYPEERAMVTQVPGILSIAGFRWGSEAQGRPHQVQIAPGRDGVPYFLRRTVSYHEAFPGHYVQEFNQRQLNDLPEFRQKWGFRAYNEAWAFYAEQLAWDLGCYEEADPLHVFGFVDSKLRRAALALVDIGLHAKEWTEAQAVQYLTNTLGMGEREGLELVTRIQGNPGAATDAYSGFYCLVMLRERMQTAFRDRFRLVDYHDLILQVGPVPMSILTLVVDEHLAQAGDS